MRPLAPIKDVPTRLAIRELQNMIEGLDAQNTQVAVNIASQVADAPMFPTSTFPAAADYPGGFVWEDRAASSKNPRLWASRKKLTGVYAWLSIGQSD